MFVEVIELGFVFRVGLPIFWVNQEGYKWRWWI